MPFTTSGFLARKWSRPYSYNPGACTCPSSPGKHFTKWKTAPSWPSVTCENDRLPGKALYYKLEKVCQLGMAQQD